VHCSMTDGIDVSPQTLCLADKLPGRRQAPAMASGEL
jgi:hypothetical protein